MVVDIQSEFYKDTELEYSALSMVKNVNEIISKTDPEKVVYIQAVGQELSISLTGIVIMPILPPADLDTNLLVVNDKIYTKMKGDAFTNGELMDHLKMNNVTDILITGLMAEACVYKTAIGGVERGFNISIDPNAILGTSEKEKQSALDKLARRGVEILLPD
jgi:nicotinamidase/pyrazinamidase